MESSPSGHWRRLVVSRTVALTAMLLVQIFDPARSLQAQQQDPLLLPFTTSDVVVTLNPETGQFKALTGVIQDLIGGRVILRRGGAGRIDTIRLRNVHELRFGKSNLFDDGLRLAKVGQWAAAVDSFDRAVIAEPRRWAQREIDAASARALLALRRYDAVIERIEQISASDPATRHVHLLPLVWDERISETERFQADVSQLASTSAIRRLSAASALLHDLDSRAPAKDVLVELRTSGIPGIQELATAQLWRIPVLENTTLRPAERALWKNRASSFAFWLRGGPLALLGRMELAAHDYDAAAASFLWLPTMQADDRPLAAACMIHGAKAVRMSGRPGEAKNILAEAATRYPKCSAIVDLSTGATTGVSD
jgi:tetratricopeptide (TPR) repeat protein